METKKLTGLWKIARSANWWWPYRDIVFICERHKVVSFDENKRLHREDGPAIEYPDGTGCYVWHGLRVSRQLIMEPETITAAMIDAEHNAEQRRAMIERKTPAWYLQVSGAEYVDEDTQFRAKLWRKPQPDDTPIFMLELENHTLESDGTRKHYWLEVNPRHYGGMAAKSAKAALASTYRVDKLGQTLFWKDYNDMYFEFMS